MDPDILVTARAIEPVVSDFPELRLADSTATYDGVIVLGMHRSGSSATAALFARAGFFAFAEGDDLRSSRSNPLGYFERRSIMELNNEFLAGAGGSWEKPPARDELAVRNIDYSRRAVEALHNLRQEAGDAPVLVKDPRIAVLLPAWWRAIDGALSPVIALRNPLESAWSLASRDGLSVPAGLALWEIYMTSMLDGLHGQDVHVVRYDTLLADAGAAIDLVQTVMATVSAAYRPALRELSRDDVNNVLDSRLQRFRATPAEFTDHATSRQIALWEFLVELGEGRRHLSAPEEFRHPSHAALATVGHEASTRERLASLAGVEGLEARVEELDSQVVTLTRQLDDAASERNERVGTLEAALTEVRDHVARLEAANRALTDAQRERDQLRSVAQEALQELRAQTVLTARSFKEHSELERQYEQLAGRHRLLERDLHDHVEELQKIRQCETWRAGRIVTAPLRWVKAPFRRSP